MSQTIETLEAKPRAAAMPAYAALILGIAAAALFPLPVFATLIGIAGLATALYARRVFQGANSSVGTVPSLLGAALSIFGIVSSFPWLFAIIMMAFAR
jgi:hypothetical protein